jgi:predicted pyridoxine 5'-phosphate oxidase superfamily flavin-nucleotide-binding protein
MTDSRGQKTFYHDGMRELQDRFDGRRVADGLQKHRLHDTFWDQDRKLIEAARFFFIATSYQDNTDCSMRSGDPGFVKITGPDTLEFPEYDGNNMYRTLGNILRNPNVGLLFVQFDGKSGASPPWLMMRPRSRVITEPSSLCVCAARSSPTVPGTFPISWAREATFRTTPSCPGQAMNRPHLNGKAATT